MRRTIRTIVAFESEKNRTAIAEMLERGGVEVRYRCRTAAETLRAVKKMGGGVVVCGSRFPDGTAQTLAEELRDTASLLLVAKPEGLDLCEDDSVFKLPAPVRPGALTGSVQMLIQLDQMRARRQVPRRSPEDEALIRRACAAVMERSGVTEQEAYRFIQRKSMETCAKMCETARLILAALD